MSPEEEILNITRGDPVLARVVQRSLQRLATGAAGDALREMAKDVLDGRVSLRDAVTAEAYAGALSERLVPFSQQYDQMPPAERERGATTIQKRLDKIREDLA
jgi:hypothetical protein